MRNRALALATALPLAALAACDSGETTSNVPAAGTATGRLVYLGCEEPVAGAKLRVAGTGVEVVTADDGTFRLDLPPGTWDAALVDPLAMPEQLVDGIVVEPGRAIDQGEIVIWPAELPERCADGAAPDAYVGGTPEVEEDDAWEEDLADYPPLPEEPGLPEDEPSEEEPLDPADLDPEAGEGQEGQGLFGPGLEIPELERFGVSRWPDLAEPTDPAEVVRLLADLEADTDEAAEDDLPYDGRELAAGEREPSYVPEGALGQLEQGLGRCPKVRLERVSAYVGPYGNGHCQAAPAGTSLERYIKGVVFAEVGILAYHRTASGKRLIDQPKKLEQFFRTFAVAARTYVVRRTGNPKAARVESGPRFQCYRRPGSLKALDRALKGTRGQIMATRTRGRLMTSEYAASCTLQVTRPEGEDGYVGPSGYLRDRPRVALSLGGRQHAHCGGHEGGGPCPGGSLDTTSNRRVRGVCQTGSAERAMSGQDYEDILGHYQPRAQICGAGPDAGKLTPISPKNITKNDAWRIRFRFRDTALEGRTDDVEYVLTLRNRGTGDVRRFHLKRRGEDQERWSAARSKGSYVVSWTPGEDVLPILRPRAKYEWWVSRVKDRDTAKQVSPKVRFATDEGAATVYLVKRQGDDHGRVRVDGTLVVPPRTAGGREEKVSFLDRGMSDEYPFAVLDVPQGGYQGGPLVWTIYKALSTGPYRFYVYDYRHPGGTSARDIAEAGTTVIVSEPCKRGQRCTQQSRIFKFRAPAGGYNYWEVFRMGEGLTPAEEGTKAYCDFRDETPTCVDAQP